MNKKQFALVVAMIVAITGFSQAQNFFPALKTFSDSEKARLDKVYFISLSSGNNGIVEEALALVAKIKLDVPSLEFPAVREQIEYLKSHGNTPMITYRAFLAAAVFDDPAMFEPELSHQYTDSNDFFESLNENMNRSLLSSK